MRYFQLIGQGVDVGPLMYTLHRKPHLWNKNRFRTTFKNTPHRDVDDILLRFSDTKKVKTTGAVMGDASNIWHPAAKELPEVKPLVLDLMRRVGGYELGRLLITRLKPGGRILRHADKDGEYVHEPDRARYHMVLQGLPGSLYMNGPEKTQETVNMLTGQVWWFNAHEEHEVVNNSVDDRIHMLIDIKTWPS